MAQNPDIEQKALVPDGLENKALTPAVETKTVTADDLVEVTIAHPIPAGRIGNEKELTPGSSTRVSKYLAVSLVQQGLARYAK